MMIIYICEELTSDDNDYRYLWLWSTMFEALLSKSLFKHIWCRAGKKNCLTGFQRFFFSSSGSLRSDLVSFSLPSSSLSLSVSDIWKMIEKLKNWTNLIRTSAKWPKNYKNWKSLIWTFVNWQKFKYSDHLNTRQVYIQMVDLCRVVKWSRIQMEVWKLDWY